MYSAGTVHKFLASVVTFQDDVFYPMEIVSPNDGVFFEAWVQRDTMELNETPDADNEIEIIDVRVSFHMLYYYFNQNFQTFQQSIGPSWVKSSSVFITLISLPPGKSWLNTELSCANTEILDNYAVFIYEQQIVGGPVGGIPEGVWENRIYEKEKTTTAYKVIENFGANEAVVPVASVIRALKEGNTSCELKVGDPNNFRSAQLNLSSVSQVSIETFINKL